jgi:hypothetical protein
MIPPDFSNDNKVCAIFVSNAAWNAKIVHKTLVSSFWFLITETRKGLPMQFSLPLNYVNYRKNKCLGKALTEFQTLFVNDG